MDRIPGPEPRDDHLQHFVDDEIIKQIMGFGLDDPGLSPRENDRRRWGLRIQFYAQMGYDYLPMEIAPRFAQRSELLAADTAHYSRGQRGWVDEHGGPIRSMADLENPANWPQVADLADYDLFLDVAAMLPPGMKIIGGLSGGPFEHASFLMGLEPLSIALYDAPELATRLFARIGEALTGAAERLAALEGRVAILGGIDMHFLATAAPHEIKERVKRTLDACAPGGGYALGSGNTVANYIPVPNYLAMLEAAREWNGL